jgi:Protein of unknown function (DUF1588)/Protein of unknown function (DUF1592)/Protein of unknown function (DUF1595)
MLSLGAARPLLRRPLTCVFAVLCVAVALSAAGLGLKAQNTANPSEDDYKTLDPKLHDAARQYFPSDDRDAAPRRIFRLTREQIDQTVATLLPDYVKTSVKTAMARDPLQTNYEYAEVLSLNNANLGALSGWFGEISERVRKNPAGLIKCQGSPPAADCLQTEAQRFIVRAFRGDVPVDKLDQFLGFYKAGVAKNGFGAATGDLVEVVLNSPGFLFRQEIETDRRGLVAPSQRLQALTYSLADVPPERLKFDATGALEYLQSEGDKRSTVDQIIKSPEARAKLTRFFKAWLEVRDPGEFTISAEVFPEFTTPLATAMVEETDRFLAAQLSKPTPTLKDITQTQASFVSKALEPIYGTKPADPAGKAAVALDPAQRMGIFSQPAVLASHSGPTNTRLIKRGVFWVRKVMCMELEPPPKDLHAELYDLKGTTERAKVEASTTGAACIGCHKVINPFGFFQENYDALGRWRTLDNNAPIDAAIKVDFLDEEPSKTAGPVDALKTFTGSAMFKQCFVRQLFRFYMGRSVKVVRTLALSDRLARRQ